MHFRSNLFPSHYDLIHDVAKSVVWISVEDFPYCIFSSSACGHTLCDFAFSPHGVVKEFLILLATIEKITGEELSFDFVDALFHSFVQFHGSVSLHIDSDVFEQLLFALRSDSFFSYYFAGQLENCALSSLERFVRQPQVSLREVLLPQLIKHVHLGCGYLRLFRYDSFVYGVRAALVQAFLQSFYRALWRDEKVFLTVLPALHSEQAVVNIYHSEVSSRPLSFPFLCSYCHGMYVFVNYPQLVSLIVLRMYYFITGYFKTSFLVQRDVFTDIFQYLFQRYIGAEYRHFARGLPIYDLHISPDGVYTVALKGHV